MIDNPIIEMGGVYNTPLGSGFRRNIYTTPDKIDTIRNQFNNTDVYATAYTYDNRDITESLLYGPLYIDLDYNIKNARDFRFVQRDLCLAIASLNVNYKIPLDSIAVFFSGHKGFHITVDPHVFGAEPCKDLHHYYKMIAESIKSMYKTVDTKIYDNKRLLRLPNSINGKTGRYKIPISIKVAREISYEEILKLAESPQPLYETNDKINLAASVRFRKLIQEYKDAQNKPRGEMPEEYKGKLMPCIQRILDNGVSVGVRNNTTALVASALFQRGSSYEEVCNILTDWNDTKVRPKMSEAEILHTVNSVKKMVDEKRKFGCTSVNNLGFCIRNECEYYKRINGGHMNGR